MNESTVLDFVELRLSSPSSSRCELYISAEGQTEKLACGFVKTFLSHVRAAQELYAAGAGLTLRLEGPHVYNGSRRPWFTKGTLARFIQYVSTPEVLERVKTIEDELIQLEQVRSIQANSFPEAHDTFLSTNQTVLRSGLFPPEYHLGHCHYTNAADNSKRELLRAMDVRLSALQQEQSVAFCRATAAGFDADGIEDLLAFSDFFGADHLRVACNWFHELFSKWQRAADKLDEHSSQEMKSEQSYATEQMEAGAPRRTTLMDGTHDTRGVRIPVMADSVASDCPSPPDEAESVSPVRLHGHASKGISQRMSPRRRSASPLKKVQVGRFGSRRTGSVVIRSINYFSERQSKERNQEMDTSSSDSEGNAKSYVLDEPSSVIIRSSPAAARRLSVQAAINLFESRQGREEGPGKQKSAKPQSRRGSLDGANTSMPGKFELKQPGEGDFDLSSAVWQERGVARPAVDSADRCGPRSDFVVRSPRSHANFIPTQLNSEEAYLHPVGACLVFGKQIVSPKKAPCLQRGSSTSEDFFASELDGMGDSGRMLEPAESDFSSTKSTVTSISHSDAHTERNSVSVDSKVYQSTPTCLTLTAPANEALCSQGFGSLQRYQAASFTEKGPTNCDGQDIDSRYSGSRDCAVSSDLSIQSLASLADCPLVNDEVSSTNEGRFYEHYRKLRDARMMEEQESKRAEREAKLRSMEEILDLRKAEMDARTAKLNKDGSHAKTRAAKLLALKANLRDIQRVQEDGVVEDSKIQASSTKDCSRSKKAGATSQKSSTTPRSSTRAVSVSPKTTPRGTVGKVSNQRTAASMNISENSLACSVPCFSDLKKENAKPSPGKPSGSAHMHFKNGGALVNPPATSRTSVLDSNGGILLQNSSNSRTTRGDRKNRARQTKQSIATGELRDLASAPDDEVSVVVNTQKDVKTEAPVISKIRRSAVAPIQEVRPFLRKGTGIGPGAGPGVLKLKAEAVKSSDEDTPGTPMKISDEELPAIVSNITDISDGEFLPVVEGSTEISAQPLSYANEDERVEVQASMISDVDVTHHSDGGFFALCDKGKLAEPSRDDELDNERACHTISFPIDFVTHERYAATHASEPDPAPQQAPREEVGRREVSATLSQLLSESVGQGVQTEHSVNGSASFRANLASEEHNASRFSPMTAVSLASSSLKRLGAVIPDYFSPSSAAAIVESPIGSPASWNSSQVQYASENDVTRSQKKSHSSQKPVVVIVPPKEPARGFKRLLKFGRKSRAAPEIFVTDCVSASTPSEGDDDVEEVNVHSAQDVFRKVKLQERILKDFGIANVNGSIRNISDKGSVQSLQTSIPIPPSNFELKYDHAPGTSKLKAPRSFFSLSTFRSRGSEGKSR
ncbi:hypothetical protein GOP47_0022717 [Adiantum capillus-veneris]|uniref:Uncharacterized protein n=1 Tax=Adiantum capillus-veneris TaxID=13818 RepID=A0A9D4U707_ADICA|nr:hypothetical protein GOP47_0022717 [Adiantum capillus-veneris]